LFDFFDAAARRHGISDPEVVHTWKSNRSVYYEASFFRRFNEQCILVRLRVTGRFASLDVKFI